jgi:hypothetical protein
MDSIKLIAIKGDQSILFTNWESILEELPILRNNALLNNLEFDVLWINTIELPDPPLGESFQNWIITINNCVVQYGMSVLQRSRLEAQFDYALSLAILIERFSLPNRILVEENFIKGYLRLKEILGISGYLCINPELANINSICYYQVKATNWLTYFDIKDMQYALLYAPRVFVKGLYNSMVIGS